MRRARDLLVLYVHGLLSRETRVCRKHCERAASGAVYRSPVMPHRSSSSFRSQSHGIAVDLAPVVLWGYEKD